MKTNINTRVVYTAPGEGQKLPRIGTLKVSSAQTDGMLEVIELDGPTGPSAHIHHKTDECFYVIEGHFTFNVEGERIEAPAGSVVFIPRGTRHAYTHSMGARALGIVMPAGLEGFLKELGEGIAAGRTQAELRAELASKYDTEPAGE